MAAGFWAGQKVRTTLQANHASEALASSSMESSPLPETELPVETPSGGFAGQSGYPLPSSRQPVTETAPVLPVIQPAATQLAHPTALPAEPSRTLPPAQEAIPTLAQPEAPEPPGSQHSLLVISVDDLTSPAPRLQSVWLVLSVNGVPRFTLMPVYPQILPQDRPVPSTPDELAQAFSVNPAGEPEQEFLQALEARGIGWDASVLLDQIVIANIISIAYKGEHLPDIQAIQAVISPTAQDTQEVVIAQAWLGQQLCQNLTDPAIDERPQLFNLFSLIPGHLRTDLDLQSARGELEAILKQSSSLVCEIPLLSGGGIEP